jgi:hypothetical protein
MLLWTYALRLGHHECKGGDAAVAFRFTIIQNIPQYAEVPPNIAAKQVIFRPGTLLSF